MTDAWTLSKNDVDALTAFHKWGNEVAADMLAAELENAIDYIERNALVHVTPLDKTMRPFYGVVEVTNVEAQTAIVRHIGGRVYPKPFHIDEMKLIYSAAAREPEIEMAATR